MIWQKRAEQDNNPAIVAPNGLEFKITDTKLYVAVVSLSKENDIKPLEQIKLGEIITLITEILFQTIVPNVEIKDFNVLIDGKSFSDFSVKNEEEAYENIIKMRNNNDNATGNLLDFGCYKEIMN